MPRYPWRVLLLAPILVLLHQNFWMWERAGILFGFPVNLLYHILLSLLVSGAMLLVVRRAWPASLDD